MTIIHVMESAHFNVLRATADESIKISDLEIIMNSKNF